MAVMDITKHVEAVAEIINDEITSRGMAVIALAEKSGIPRTTLMRRLEYPNSYPFTVAELAQISDVFGSRLSTIIQRAEALASKEGEAK